MIVEGKRVKTDENGKKGDLQNKDSPCSSLRTLQSGPPSPVEKPSLKATNKQQVKGFLYQPVSSQLVNPEVFLQQAESGHNLQE